MEDELQELTEKFDSQMKRHAHVKKAIVIVLGLLVLAGIVYAPIYMMTGYYGDTSYEIDQAYRYIQQAASTNSIPQTLDHLYKAQTILMKYSGDPKWWYPTGESNFDMINANLAATILSLENMKDQPLTSYATQQQIVNIRDSLTELNHKIDSAAWWIYWTPLAVLALALMLLAILGGGTATVYCVGKYKPYDSYDTPQKAREKAKEVLKLKSR